MKRRAACLILVLVMVGEVANTFARPSAADVARAGALAAQIKTPAVRAALQCRVAFADTTASVPVKDRTDTKATAVFWASYLQKLHGIDVSGCPDSFRAAFERHVRAVRTVADSLNRPAERAPVERAYGAQKGDVHSFDPRHIDSADAPTFGESVRSHYDGLDECGRTYKAVFAAANQSMKTAPAADGQLAEQVDALLKEGR